MLSGGPFGNPVGNPRIPESLSTSRRRDISSSLEPSEEQTRGGSLSRAGEGGLSAIQMLVRETQATLHKVASRSMTPRRMTPRDTAPREQVQEAQIGGGNKVWYTPGSPEALEEQAREMEYAAKEMEDRAKALGDAVEYYPPPSRDYSIPPSGDGLGLELSPRRQAIVEQLNDTIHRLLTPRGMLYMHSCGGRSYGH